MGKRADKDIPNPLKRRPEGARQHATAGPYSPVLEVDAQRLVVISGQVAVDLDGRVIGSTIEEQTRATLGNCTDCLASAGCTLGDVFKVNIYLADLGHWTRFNEIYQARCRSLCRCAPRCRRSCCPDIWSRSKCGR